jgi:hypothetical protein
LAQPVYVEAWVLEVRQREVVAFLAAAAAAEPVVVPFAVPAVVPFVVPAVVPVVVVVPPEQQMANPSTKHQAGLSLSAAELAEVLALIAVFASLQGQHMKALED